ncbi:MAG: DUF2029 domain-containing protein, partial [Pedobacter sp.]
LSLAFWAVVLFVLPMAISSPGFIVQTYQDWYYDLIAKNTENMTAKMQNISVLGMIARMFNIGDLNNTIVLIPAILLFLLPYLRVSAYRFQGYRLLLLASVLIFTVIFSSSAESPTYIIALTGVGIWFMNLKRPVTKFDIFLLVFAIIITSLSPSDLFPKAINVKYIQELISRPATNDAINAIRQEMGTRQVILSVERLDYVKGPLEKIYAFQEFLEEYPEFHEKIVLINICTPPAQGMKIYEKIQQELEQAIGKINGKYSTVRWTPIRFFFRSFSFEEVVQYYSVADIAWITPLRDGLNLVAKEYVAVQGMKENSNGVLILSEFAGASVELGYAVRTNPYDRKSLKEGLLHALVMETTERQMRMRRLYDSVHHYDIDFWGNGFMKELENIDGDADWAEKVTEMATTTEEILSDDL